jgi:hypothetical protein
LTFKETAGLFKLAINEMKEVKGVAKSAYKQYLIGKIAEKAINNFVFCIAGSQ